MKTTEERIIAVVADYGVPPAGAQITPASNLREDLGCDSLDEVEILMGLEEEFAVEIPEEALKGVTTVGDLVAMVEKRLK